MRPTSRMIDPTPAYELRPPQLVARCGGSYHIFPPHVFVCQCGKIRAQPIVRTEPRNDP